jgi:hypothetical protein
MKMNVGSRVLHNPTRMPGVGRARHYDWFNERHHAMRLKKPWPVSVLADRIHSRSICISVRDNP